MIATSETRFTLLLSEQEYEDVYEAIEGYAEVAEDDTRTQERIDYVRRLSDVLGGLPVPPSRERMG